MGNYDNDYDPDNDAGEYDPDEDLRMIFDDEDYDDYTSNV